MKIEIEKFMVFSKTSNTFEVVFSNVEWIRAELQNESNGLNDPILSREVSIERLLWLHDAINEKLERDKLNRKDPTDAR
jgi:hypothetical protein